MTRMINFFFTVCVIFSPPAFAVESLKLKVCGQNYDLESVSTNEDRAKGLMYRDKLEKNHGMIFIYPDEQPRSFWMKNTKIPLLILFFDKNGKSVGYSYAKPGIGVLDSKQSIYSSLRPATYVVEVDPNSLNKKEIDKKKCTLEISKELLLAQAKSK